MYRQNLLNKKIMSKASILQKAKDLLSRIEKVALSVEGVKLSAEGKLTDGTMVATPDDAFAVGSELYVVVEGAEPTPAPDGEHTLEDGTIVIVSEGRITEIKPVEAGKEEQELSDVLAQLSERISALEAANTAQTAELAAAKTEAETAKTELASVKGQLEASKAEVLKLSKMPASKSVKDEKINLQKEKEKEAPKKSFSQMTYLERIISQNQ
jgi:hypothetical protein